VALVGAVFMALAEPFGAGTHSPLWVRLAYWIGLLTAGTLLVQVIGVLATRMDFYERRPWLWALLVTLIITPPMTVVVWAVSGTVFIGAVKLDQLPGYGIPVLVVSLVMLAVGVLADQVPYRTHAAPQGAPEPAFLKRLPAKLAGAELCAVQAEDHYLRLHTTNGQDMILMRLADALAELEGLEGAQTHRSWWVARAAVVGAERADGRAELTLKCGAVAPVSRTYAKALRTAGWF